MRWADVLAVVIAFTGVGLCADQQPLAMLPCPPGASEATCNPSTSDLKEAKSAFAHGVKLQKSDPGRRMAIFDRAAQFAPADVEYLTARELARQQLVYTHIKAVKRRTGIRRTEVALADFRAP